MRSDGLAKWGRGFSFDLTGKLLALKLVFHIHRKKPWN